MSKAIWTKLPAAIVALAMGLSAIQWLINPAAAAESLGMLLLAMAALFRTGAWLFHGASLASALIIVEIVLAGLLLLSAWLISKPVVQRQ